VTIPRYYFDTILKAREALLQEPFYVIAGADVESRNNSLKGDFIYRALAGFSLNNKG
jgi:hypothetical protein